MINMIIMIHYDYYALFLKIEEITVDKTFYGKITDGSMFYCHGNVNLEYYIYFNL